MKPPNKNGGPTKQNPEGNPAPSRKRVIVEDENSKKGPTSKRPAFGDITNAVSLFSVVVLTS
jgi:hypothetical protein